MDFLRNSLSVALVEPNGKHSVFAANLLHKRPKWAEIEEWRDGAPQLQESFQKILKRSACPVAWVGVFIDTDGVWLLATRKSRSRCRT